MRLATIASIAILAPSSAALAQVASVPVEQKTSPGNTATSAKDAEAPDNATDAGGAAVLDNAAGDASAADRPAPKVAPRPR
jgi:hypothetical protein